jgi:PBP1b-binding outer membrane lipoprotein LpoB
MKLLAVICLLTFLFGCNNRDMPPEVEYAPESAQPTIILQRKGN